MPSSQRRVIPIARILRFHWRVAWRYPGLVVGCLLATPLTVLVDTILPPLIVSDVLNRLSTGHYQRNQLWTSFSTNLITYAVVVFLGWAAVELEASRRDSYRQFSRVFHLVGRKGPG